ncbi:MAG TPA: VCBS repeat-containing protein [Steroidobacteraceae bacterium]|nr:VCBS repeat-containing protein [Steroidobacteraceae bacterium]
MHKFIGRRSAGIRRLALAGLAATLGVLPGCDDNSEPNLPAIIPVPNSIAVANLTGPGVPDLVVATTADEGLTQNPGYANVILNTPGKLGTFQPGVGHPTTGTNPSSIAVADLTGTGGLDLVVANFGTGSVSLFLHGCTTGTCAIGAFQPAVDVTTGGMPNQVVIADLNGDGKPDLVLADMSSNGNAIVLMADPANPGKFLAPMNLSTGRSTPSVAVGDLNGDGLPDIVAATSDAAGNNGAVYVFMQNPAKRGTFLAPMIFAAGAQPQSVRIADVNGDGLLDLVVANQGPGSDGIGSAGVSVLLQDASHPGTFLAPVTYATPGFAIDVAVGDLNGDNKPDLVVANLNPPPGGSISVLLQDPAHPGMFLPASNYAGLSQPLSVVIADLNGDGQPDIAVADGISATVLFQNAGAAGTFAQAVQVGASPPPF